MKQLVSVLTGICSVAAITCSLALLWTEWSFSFLFKSLLLFSSAFIGLTAFRTSNFNQLAFFVATLCFVALAVILSYPALYSLLWNSVLAGHILLIGSALYLDVRNHRPSLLQKITSGSIIVSVSAFTILLIIKAQNPLFYTVLFLLLVLTSILFITSKLLFFLRK